MIECNEWSLNSFKSCKSESLSLYGEAFRFNCFPTACSLPARRPPRCKVLIDSIECVMCTDLTHSASKKRIKRVAIQDQGLHYITFDFAGV